MLKLLFVNKRQVVFTFSEKLSPKGFTLIELLIVIAIIVIIVALAAVSYTTVNRNARDSKRQSDLAKIAASLEEYYSDHGTYPNTSGNIQSGGRSSSYDVIICLVGGIAAQNILPVGSCKTPFNIYIANGSMSNFPIDPSYTDIVDGESNYDYCSDGQTFTVVTRHYEGTPPTAHQFNSSNPCWIVANGWAPGITWGNQYFVQQPNH